MDGAAPASSEDAPAGPEPEEVEAAGVDEEAMEELPVEPEAEPVPEAVSEPVLDEVKELVSSVLERTAALAVEEVRDT